MTREALLKASIREFEDFKNNCQVWEVDRHFTDTGYCYMIKKNPKEISAAIHYNASFETDDSVGKYENNDVAINTREQLPFDSILTYKDLTFAIASMGNYNETMGQWHYAAQSAFKPISDEFLITDEAEINQKIGCNSLGIIMALDFEYPLVPSYYAATDKKSYVMLSVTSSEGITPIITTDDYVYQRKRDTLKVSFVNIDTKGALYFLRQLQEYSLMPNTEFGINSIGTLADENLYQKSFNWKSLTYSVDIDLNYLLKTDGIIDKRFSEILYKSIIVAL